MRQRRSTRNGDPSGADDRAGCGLAHGQVAADGDDFAMGARLSRRCAASARLAEVPRPALSMAIGKSYLAENS
jgi:hypothetical protein